eukprot:1134534-Rhodomonas_salina.4
MRTKGNASLTWHLSMLATHRTTPPKSLDTVGSLQFAQEHIEGTERDRRRLTVEVDVPPH